VYEDSVSPTNAMCVARESTKRPPVEICTSFLGTRDCDPLDATIACYRTAAGRNCVTEKLRVSASRRIPMRLVLSADT
jgi:hypothetical protein